MLKTIFPLVVFMALIILIRVISKFFMKKYRRKRLLIQRIEIAIYLVIILYLFITGMLN